MECTRCPLHLTANMMVGGVGPDDARLMFILEAPGALEDKKGVPLVGQSGDVFNALLKKVGISRDEVYIDNVIKHRPPKNRKPLVSEIKQCAIHLVANILRVEPEIIVTMGGTATNFMLGKTSLKAGHGKQHVLKKVWNSFELHRGRKMTAKELREYGVDWEVEWEGTVIPTYHPAATFRNPNLLPILYEDMQEIGRVYGTSNIDNSEHSTVLSDSRSDYRLASGEGAREYLGVRA